MNWLHKHLSLALFAFILLAQTVLAQEPVFRRVQLPDGISLDIPSHWTVLSQDTRKNIAAFSKSMTDNAGVEGDSNQKQNLLAVTSTPKPSGAIIRVSVTAPDFTQADLAATTPADLKEARTELLETFKKLEASGGPKIVEMQLVRIEKFDSTRRALVIPYIRFGMNDQSPWQVTQYKIPVGNRLIEITLSYRQSDAMLWRPILERVKRSVQL